MHLTLARRALRLLWAAFLLVGAELVDLAGADPYFETLLEQNGLPTTYTRSGDDFTIHHSLWFHNERFYRLVDNSSKNNPPAEFSLNTGSITLPLTHVTDFFRNLKAGWAAGVTVLVDFAFPAYPDSMGHWTEAILPIYCALSGSHWRSLVANTSAQVDTILFLNIRRDQIAELDWVSQMWALALQPGLRGGKQPRQLFFDDLQRMDRQLWLGFEHALVATDRYTHKEGLAGFRTKALGLEFRRMAYAAFGLKLPEKPPRTITFLGPVSAEEVINQEEVVEKLQEVAVALGMRVRPYTVTAEAPMASYVAAMSRTGVLVSRHGPLLANAMFLPPGAMVVELLPYNWEWKGISRLYKNLTSSIGDIHHFAWRARHPRHALYLTPDDARYAEWSAEECVSRECLEIHARCPMIADADAIQELLHEHLPGMLRGRSVQEMEQPWPSIMQGESSGRTGLFWDK